MNFNVNKIFIENENWEWFKKTGHEGGGPPSPQRGERGNHHPSWPDIESGRILHLVNAIAVDR